MTRKKQTTDNLQYPHAYAHAYIHMCRVYVFSGEHTHTHIHRERKRESESEVREPAAQQHKVIGTRTWKADIHSKRL